MWFTEIAAVENPGRNELGAFVDATITFLGFIFENPREFEFLWETEPALEFLGKETFSRDVVEGATVLKNAISEIPQENLTNHGLLGRPMSFKLKVLDSIGRAWDTVKGQVSAREWLKKVFDAIDAILDSLIQAAAGAGGIIKEFKDALSALVTTRP